MMKVRLLVTITVLSTLLGLTSYAGHSLATPDQHHQIPALARTSLNLRHANIRTVIDAVAHATGKNFIIPPQVHGTVTLLSAQPVSTQALYPLLLTVLQNNGYTAVESHGFSKIVPLSQARHSAPPLAGDHLENTHHPNDIVVRIITLRYIPADQLIPAIRPLLADWEQISLFRPTNSMILSGQADNIALIAKIVRQLDTHRQSDIDTIHLHYALADDLANTIQTLVGPQNNFETPLHIAVDNRTNSLLLSGNPSTRLQMRVLIARLDQPQQNGSQDNLQVIYLRYLSAQDLVPILAAVAQAHFSGTVETLIGSSETSALANLNHDDSGSTSSTSSSSSNTTTLTNPKATPNTKLTSSTQRGDHTPKVEIIAEPNTNAVIINAPPALIRTLRGVIAKLDIRPAQVLIEAIIAEINQDDMQKLGIDWSSLTPNFSGDPTATLGESGFILNRTIRFDQIQAALHALSTRNKASILSTPSIMVLDNHLAKISIGKQVSVQESSYPNNANGTTTASPYNTFNRLNVALHLYVKPQISQNENIKLDIDHGNDTLAEPADSKNTTPVVNQSSMNTSVLVQSGNTLVIGGLIQHQLGRKGNKIPILGDIPGIGQLFHEDIRTRDNRVLMVFIHPTIVSTNDLSLDISNRKYQFIRQQQLNWLSHQPYNAADQAVLLKQLSPTLTLPPPFAD